MLDTKEIMGSDALTKLCKIGEVEIAQYESFTIESLVQRRRSLYDPIKRNDLRVFNDLTAIHILSNPKENPV